MAAIAILALVILGLAPLAAGLLELVAEPTALAALVSPRILSLWGSTVQLGVVTALVATLVGAPMGWIAARCSGRGAGWLKTLLPLPLILPPWITGVAWTEATPLSGFWGAVFLLAASLWPLVALFALRGFRASSRPAQVARLARGEVAAWRAVELPMAWPSILSGSLLVFVFSITDFGVVDFLSFTAGTPFVVLSSEIFQKWARVGSGVGAAVASVPAIVSAGAALCLLLSIERRHAGRLRGPLPVAVPGRPLGVARGLGLGVIALISVVPLVVLVSWTWGGEAPLAAVASKRAYIGQSVGVALASALLVAGLGVCLARLTLDLSPRRGRWLLGLCLVPLAAPGVTFAVGVLRFWNHSANPLADLVYPSPWLLVLALTGRFLPLGVLVARATLGRQDRLPYEAARLVGRPWWVRVWRVDLPMLAPATGLAFALGYLLAMRELDLVVLIPAGAGTLAHSIFSMVHNGSDSVTAVLCLSLVALVLVPAVAARLLGVRGADCDEP